MNIVAVNVTLVVFVLYGCLCVIVGLWRQIKEQKGCQPGNRSLMVLLFGGSTVALTGLAAFVLLVLPPSGCERQVEEDDNNSNKPVEESTAVVEQEHSL